jgi:glycolate oxidase FAD binding subunit
MIADVAIGEIVAPGTVDEAVAIMRERAARGAKVAFMGGGTNLGYGNPVERVDTLLKTEKLTRVVEYRPSDQVVTVEAGLTLDALQKRLKTKKQRLALDPPEPDSSTIGGLLATNAYGPLRTRFGTLRDLIVGISIVRADGTLARGGGKVVKNVAGFDLPKLMVGSLGTLGLIATATFRLHPLPERREWHAVPARSLHEVRTLCRALLDRRLEPSAVVALDASTPTNGAPQTLGGYAVYVLLEGFGAGVESQGVRLRETMRDLLGAETRRIEPRDRIDVAALDEDARTFGEIRLRVSTPPAFLPALEAEVLAPLRAASAEARTVLYPTVGAAFIGGVPANIVCFVAALNQARAAAEAAGGNLVVVECSDLFVREQVDIFGTLPNAFQIMRRLKERFDPDRRLNPGRFVGGL